MEFYFLKLKIEEYRHVPADQVMSQVSVHLFRYFVAKKVLFNPKDLGEKKTPNSLNISEKLF